MVSRLGFFLSLFLLSRFVSLACLIKKLKKTHYKRRKYSDLRAQKKFKIPKKSSDLISPRCTIIIRSVCTISFPLRHPSSTPSIFSSLSHPLSAHPPSSLPTPIPPPSCLLPTRPHTRSSPYPLESAIPNTPSSDPLPSSVPLPASLAHVHVFSNMHTTPT